MHKSKTIVLMKTSFLPIFKIAVISLSSCQGESLTNEFFKEASIATVESIQVYKVRKGTDLLLLCYKSNANYENIKELESHDEKSFDSRKYYVLGSSKYGVDKIRTEWSFAIDDEDEIIHFRPIGIRCSLSKLVFHLNMLIRSKQGPK